MQTPEQPRAWQHGGTLADAEARTPAGQSAAASPSSSASASSERRPPRTGWSGEYSVYVRLHVHVHVHVQWLECILRSRRHLTLATQRNDLLNCAAQLRMSAHGSTGSWPLRWSRRRRTLCASGNKLCTAAIAGMCSLQGTCMRCCVLNLWLR